MLKNKSILILLPISMLLMTEAKAQTPQIDSLLQLFDSFYDTLDVSGMETSRLFNKGFVSGDIFARFKDSVPMIFSVYDFDAFRAPVMRMAPNLNIPEIESLEIYNTSYFLDSSVSTIAIPLIYMHGEFVRDTLIQEYVTTGANLVFEEFDFACASPLRHIFDRGDINFYFHTDLLYILDPITSLNVDFDDGQGMRSISLNQNTQVSVSYDAPGEKNIIFRIITANSDTVITYSSITINSVLPILSNSSYGYLEADTADTNIFGSRSSGNLLGIEWLYHQGFDGKLNKPVIYVEGFDVLNSTTLGTSARRFYPYIVDLKSKGFDIYIINFKDGRADLHQNTSLLKLFIKTVVNNPSTNLEKHEGLIIGLSMGGIISRMALKELENEGYDHRIGTLITSDSPHKGANISPFLQKGLVDLTSYIPEWILRNLKQFEVFGNLLNFVPSYDQIPDIGESKIALNSMGAKQMVANHINGNFENLDLQIYLNNLGWPIRSRNIALTCGSNLSTDQGFAPGDKLVNHFFTLGIVSWYFWGKASPISQSNYKYWEMVRIPIGIKAVIIFGPPMYRNGRMTFNDKPWCSAPGGKLLGTLPWNAPALQIPNMVPCVSAIDIAQTYFTGANFSIYNRTGTYNKSYLISNNYVPVQEIYSINKPTAPNLQHPFIYEEAIIRDIIINQELMPTDYYLQNRTFDKDRDIECGGDMFVGRDVLPSTKYLYSINNHDLSLSTSETKKTLPNNNVVVKPGVSLLLEATNSIVFKSGFKAENGSMVTVKVDGTNPNTRSDKNNKQCGDIVRANNETGQVVYKYSEESSDVIWNLKGYSFDEYFQESSVIVPPNLQKGQYSLSAYHQGCKIPSVVIDIKNRILQINEPNQKTITNHSQKWNITPNPGNEIVNIESNDLFVSIRVDNLEGKNIENKKVIDPSNSFNLNVSNYVSGAYLISILLKDGKIRTKKLIVKHE
jgi:hypothetical protein